MLLVEMIINLYFMHGYDCVGQRKSAHLLLYMARFKSLMFTFDGKNQKQ
jgi:hypothetical protein